MKILYPEIRPYQTEWLPVGDGHELYLERCGTPTGIPVLVVHGGPGAGCSDQMRRFFDPERYHIFIFDQRGAGRSKPHAEIRNNSTADIIADIERIREHLNVHKWVLFGGSFGATLSLLYAQQFSQHVCGLILRGVFLGRQQDLDWLYRQGAGRFFPEEWQAFQAPIEEIEGETLLRKYYNVLNGENELAKVGAAKAWARWEAANSSFRPNQSSQNYYTATHTALALARISSHFFINDCFLETDQILQNVAKLDGIPGYIVHGRYDMICPPDQAWELAEHWPSAELDLVREGGHSAFDGAMVDALVRSTRRLALRLGSPDNEA
ncbi:MAG: prolyl aminopeptidase [Reinekea sp.]|nr:prolyl aminopeptidase [Reinekea sp.]MDX1475772.1 prolyl aminopeptidase [Reinekea sp.]